MTNEMYRRAVKLLLRQARYDQPDRYHVNFDKAYVLGNKLFLTENAVKGFPNSRGLLIESVDIMAAIEYAKEYPHIVDEIRSEVYLTADKVKK